MSHNLWYSGSLTLLTSTPKLLASMVDGNVKVHQTIEAHQVCHSNTLQSHTFTMPLHLELYYRMKK